MKGEKYITSSPSRTKKLAFSIAKEIIHRSSSRKKAVILALNGELGGGKTTFIQGFAPALGIKKRILSPTFVIERKFLLEKAGFKYFYHFDCYRLHSEKEILDLNFQNIISNPENLVAIEWADKIKSILPPRTITLSFKFISERKREIRIHYE